MSQSVQQTNTTAINLDELAMEALPKHVVEAFDDIDIKFKDLREYTSKRPRARILFSGGKLIIDFRLIFSGPQIVILLGACGISGVVLTLLRHLLGF